MFVFVSLIHDSSYTSQAQSPFTEGKVYRASRRSDGRRNTSISQVVEIHIILVIGPFQIAITKVLLKIVFDSIAGQPKGVRSCVQSLFTGRCERFD
jgi:hypothetical protein